MEDDENALLEAIKQGMDMIRDGASKLKMAADATNSQTCIT